MADAGLVELVAPDGDLTARFAVGAGMVGCSLREGGEELLGIGGGLPAYLDHGAVFGIPRRATVDLTLVAGRRARRPALRSP